VVGAVATVVLVAVFPQQRGPFLVGLALWAAACALLATLLANFGSYAAALAGYTAAIIGADQLGATGGPNGQVFMLAVTRVSEIWLGIASAEVVMAGTDLGSAPRRLAVLLASLSSEVARERFGIFAETAPEPRTANGTRNDLTRRVVGIELV